MSMVWIAVLVLAGPAGEVGTASAASSSQGLPANEVQQPLVPLRTGRALAEAAHKALARWAHADEKDAEAAAREFLVLYKELQADTRLPAADRRELLGKVRGRLVRLSQMIARVVARRLGLAGQQPATVATVGNPAGVLAQQRRRAAREWRCPAAAGPTDPMPTRVRTWSI